MFFIHNFLEYVFIFSQNSFNLVQLVHIFTVAFRPYEILLRIDLYPVCESQISKKKNFRMSESGTEEEVTLPQARVKNP